VLGDPPGQAATLTLYDDAGALGCIVLGPAEAVALASDLLLTARLRYGRAHPAEIPSEAA
jgi:ethanolamine utilization microcompartment shell protein EutS